MKVVRVLPRHVKACQHSASKLERWFVWTWPRSGAVAQTRVPYSCNSWRCETCRRHEAAVTFARFKEAATRPELDPRGWCFLVLTLDRNGHESGRPWRDVNEAYRALSKLTTATLRKIGATWGPDARLQGKKRQRTVRVLGNRWVAVVEAHRSGWPHVNLMVWCPELAEQLDADRAERLADPELADAVAEAQAMWRSKLQVGAELRERARQAVVVRGPLRDMLTDSGWGYQSTAERARDLEAMIGYGVKLAGLHDSSVGELAKVTQCPMNAPERFRRLRSGKGFLPPRRSNPEITGCLVRRRRASAGDWEICSVNAPKDPAQAEPIERAARAELAMIAEEESLLARNRGRLPPMPPLRIAIRGELESHKDTSERRSALRNRELAACG